MPDDFARYVSAEEDNARWLRFARRPGDIIISTRSKHGTTWMQMLCALLIFQTPDLPATLAQLSPWLDWLLVPEDAVFEQLEAQHHRRFIKTHTPLDGLPFDPDVTYIVVARRPLDAAVSLYYQGDNLDRERIMALTGAPESGKPAAPRPELHDWLVSWIDRRDDPCDQLDSLPGVMSHLSGVWARRAIANVVLIHYDDLVADLTGEMHRLAARLRIEVSEQAWPALVTAAGFASMRERADQLVPDPSGILLDRSAFFRQGRSGAGRELLTEAESDRYFARVAELAPSELLIWLHREYSAH